LQALLVAIRRGLAGGLRNRNARMSDAGAKAMPEAQAAGKEM